MSLIRVLSGIRVAHLFQFSVLSFVLVVLVLFNVASLSGLSILDCSFSLTFTSSFRSGKLTTYHHLYDSTGSTIFLRIDLYHGFNSLCQLAGIM